ncbi:MAG: protein kinase [Clostridia bacterium]
MTDRLIADRYQVEGLIGSGGMANVYKAYDIKENRTIALKVLKDEHREDADFVRRFEREAAAVLTLSHPNIVKSFDVGEDGDVNFIVLEFVEGSTLKEKITNGGALSPKTAVNIAVQVLNALSHAHERGIIHRDVKPQNVIIMPDGTAKLTDFGIARDAGATTRTFAGTNVIGSVHYLSPEQARGEQVTVESDIYSCGIMLYEMLTGRVPFGGDNSVAIALKHLQEEMVPPIKVNPWIPHSLSDVTMKATAKNPAMRYSSAQAMCDDLQRALHDPHGRFARQKADAENHAPTKRGNKLVNITISLIVALGLFTTMFLIAKTWKDTDNSGKPEYIVPTLTGKATDEAGELASLRGFVMNITGKEINDEYEEGYVINQSPASGAKGSEGDMINVIVSSGSDYAVVPEVTGIMLSDGIMILDQEGLNYSIVEYIPSDLPDGQIIKQEPAANTQVFENDYVDIWVSGMPDQSVDVPAVSGQNVDTAVSTLMGNGFNHIWIRTTAPENTTQEENVIRQSPASGVSTPKTTILELLIGRTYLGSYCADIAFNLDIEDTEKNVVVTMKLESGAEIIMYESAMAAGKQQPVSFTGYSLHFGEYTCIAYVNGEEVRRSTQKFTLR